MTGQVVNRKFINDLPLVDRYVLDFVSLGPGITNMSDQNSVGDTGTNFVSNGSRGASADILMDGASITNFEPNGGITNVTYTPSAEAVEEFKVEQTNFSAEYGFSGASVVNMITRSGGNSFHGSAYDFIRNQITDANNWFANASGPPASSGTPQQLRRHHRRPDHEEQDFSFSLIMTARGIVYEHLPGGRAQLRRNAPAILADCAQRMAARSTVPACAAMAAGQIWDPYTGTFQAPQMAPPAHTAAHLFRSTIWLPIPARGIQI